MLFIIGSILMSAWPLDVFLHLNALYVITTGVGVEGSGEALASASPAGNQSLIQPLLVLSRLSTSIP